VRKYCNTAYTQLLWARTKISPIIVIKSRKTNKEKKIPRLLGKDVNSHASGHKTVYGLGGNFPCGQVVSVTTYCRVSGMPIL